MCEAHGAIGHIDMLTAAAAGTINIKPTFLKQIIVIGWKKD